MSAVTKAVSLRQPALGLLLLSVIVLTGCSALSQVDVNVRSNGSGAVVVEVDMDPEAAASVPNLSTQLHAGDLIANGWTVDNPTKDSNGNTVVKIRHGFANINEANAVLAALGANGGPFRDFKLVQHRSLTKVSTQFSGRVDLTRGIESFGDDVLRSRTGSPLGFDPNEVQKSLGVNWQTSFPVDVVVHVPGNSRTELPATASDHVWHIPYGAVTSLDTRAKGWNVEPMVFIGLTLVSLLGAIAVALLWKSDRYRPKHRSTLLHGSDGVRARDLLANEPTSVVDLVEIDADATTLTAEMSQAVHKVSK